MKVLRGNDDSDSERESMPLIGKQFPQEAVAEEPKPADAADPETPTRTISLIYLLMRLPETRWRFFLAVSAAVLNGSTFPAFSIVFGQMFNSFYTLGYEDISYATAAWSVGFALVGLVGFTFTFLQVSFFGAISEILSDHLRRLLFDSLVQKDVAFFDKHNSGELTSRLQADMTAVQAGCSEKIGQFVQSLTQCLLGVIVAMYYGWQMTLVLLSVCPLLIIAMAIMATFMQKSQRGSSDEYAISSTISTEVLSSFRTVLAFNREDYERARYQQSLLGPMAAGIKRGLATALGMAVTFFIIFGTYALGFWYGGKLVVDGEMSIGDELTVFFSIIMGAMGIGQGMAQLPDMVKARAAAGAIYDLIETPIEVDRHEFDGRDLAPNAPCAIDLDDVHFRYPSRPDNDVLGGVSLHAEPGQTLALVGASGSGKSSILQLILRFYDPLSGGVLIDGVDIRQYKLSSYRSLLGLVSQEPILFSGSIDENIRYGNLTASHEQVVEAAKRANAHDFIVAQPQGYETLVGEKGTQLSGGQKQRVAIARAILKNPRILLLDEATSALDSESEKLVQDALNKLMRGRTTIIVAHRLSTIQEADCICYLAHGRIQERGTHLQLMELRGGYWKLIQRQTWTAEDYTNHLAERAASSSSPEGI